MSFCKNCGTPAPENGVFCCSCGAALRGGDQRHVSSESPRDMEEPAPLRSLGRALENLGLGHLKTQVSAFMLAWIGGILVSWSLPYFYDAIFGRIVSFFVGTEITNTRDTFNVWLMTTVTFGTSFFVAYFGGLSLNYAIGVYNAARRRIASGSSGQ
jgi:hypothetical protein